MFSYQVALHAQASPMMSVVEMRGMTISLRIKKTN